MLESLKSLWSRWRVQVTFVGGALVVATAYGTCSYDPQEVSEEEPATEEAAATEDATLEVNNTTTEAESTTSEDNTTSETNTTGE